MAVLPPVPTTGAQTVAGRRVAERTPGSTGIEPVLPRRGGGTRGRTRKGGRRQGALACTLGVLMVLSSVYGVAQAVSGDNVLTDTASSFRSYFGGHQKVVHHGNRDRAARDRAPAVTPATGTATPEAAGPEVAGTDEGPAEIAATGDVEGTGSSSADVSSSDSVLAPAAAAPGVAAPVGATVTTASAVPAGTWLSGASGDGVASGAFGAWRGSPVLIGGTWADNNTAMTELWQLDSGGEFGSWDQALDIAIGAIGEDESWQQAAQGAYDQRWRESLTNLRDKWGDRTAPLFIRFAHEMNGDWYDWSVNSGNKDAFVASWKHFRALQQEIFPASQLVFSLNRESVNSGFDWRESFPGAEYVDVIGVDYYNQYPTVTSAAQWADSLDDVDDYGAPKGLQQHLDFARSVGLPLAVPEWSGHAGNGDSAPWMQGMHDFFVQHAGGGAGQVVYDVQFNIDMHDDDYRVYPTTNMPASAEAYRRLF